MTPTTTPESLIEASDCLAQSLTVSKDHATILLRSSNKEGEVIRSLIKLTVLPTHTSVLAPSCDDIRGLEPEDLGAAFDPTDSFRIKGFLSTFSFTLCSESGAEYSFFDAIPKADWVSSMSQFVLQQPKPAFRVELISPATEKQIQRCIPAPAQIMVEETQELYNQVVLPYIQGIVDSGSLSWIDNVISGKKEMERLLLDTDDYILNVDTKWKTHPDPNTISKKRWSTYDKRALEDLYCLAIVKQSGLATIRDLRKKHIPMLKDILEQCPRVIQEVYMIPRNQLRIFFHYQPQFYHLHVHFTRLENDIGCEVERGHLLSDVIQNLEMDESYYVHRTITYKLRINDGLWKRFDEMRALEELMSDFTIDETTSPPVGTL